MTATWQISPRHPSTRETTTCSGRIGFAGRADRALRERGELGLHEVEGALRLEPAHEGARVHVAVVGRHHGDVGEAVDPGRVVAPHVLVDAAGPRRGADEPERLGRLRVDPPGPLETRRDGRRREEQLGRAAQVLHRLLEPPAELGDERLVEVDERPAGPDEAAAEAIAAEERGHVQEVAPEPPAEGGRRQEPDVAGEGAEVARVVREALELERDAANRLRARRGGERRERLDRLGVGRRVADRGVAGERLDPGGGLPVGTAEERLLDPAVLEAEGDLEVEDALAVALEAEVPRLDDPRVDRADGDLVDLVPLDAEEVADGGQDRLALLPPPRVVARTPRRPVADRLEPRVPLGPEAELLGHLPLEEVRLRRGGRQRREAVVGRGAVRATASVPGPSSATTAQSAAAAPASGAAKKETSRRPAASSPRRAPAEVVERGDGDLRERERRPVPRAGEDALRHGSASRPADALSRRLTRGAGR